VAIYDGDLAIDTMNFFPRDTRNTPTEHGSRLKFLDDSDINSGYQTPVQETTSSRGNGFQYGRNWLVGHISPDPSRTERAPRRHPESNVRRGETSFSQQLYEDRSLLKPIAFVPSMLPSLFLNEEEIFKPMAEDADEQEASHAPTADRVFQIFHRSNLNPSSSESPSGAELPVIDFMDLGRVMNEMEVFEVEAVSSKNDACKSIKVAEDQATMKTIEESFMGDRIDVKLSPVQGSLTPANHIPVERPDTHIPVEDVEDDVDIIVYDAPNPRKGMHLSSSIPSSSAAAVTIPPLADSEPVYGQVQQRTNDSPSPTDSPAEPTLEHTPTSSPKLSPVLTSGDVSNAALSESSRSVRPFRRPPHVSKRRVKRHVTFGSFGAIRAEAALREVDPQRDEQRRGDSDVDWGVLASEGSVEDGGMQVDNDMDVHAMKAFVKGMGIAGSAPVTVDDLAEDEENSEEGGPASDGSSDDDDEELELADDNPNFLISEDEGDPALGDALISSEDESTSDEEGPPRSFQARLDKLRKRTEGRPIKDILKDELDGELEDDDDDSLIAQIQEILDDNDEVLSGRDRKQRNRIFQAIQHGNFEHEMDFADSPARACFIMLALSLC